jgi:hypothetical protein
VSNPELPAHEEWLAYAAAGRAEVLPHRVSRTFHDHLLTLPWAGSGLAWATVGPHVHGDISQLGTDFSWLMASTIGEHSHLALFDSPSRPALLISFFQFAHASDDVFATTRG